MEFLRTPEERFEGLFDYPFEPHYVDVSDLEGGVQRAEARHH
jgi:haloalkane dehalogenase